MLTHDQVMDALPEARRAAVSSFLAGALATCPECAQPVRRMDPRRTGAGGLQHLDCRAAPTQPAESAVAPEPESRAVAARARRSDWG